MEVLIGQFPSIFDRGAEDKAQSVLVAEVVLLLYDLELLGDLPGVFVHQVFLIDHLGPFSWFQPYPMEAEVCAMDFRRPIIS